MRCLGVGTLTVLWLPFASSELLAQKKPKPCPTSLKREVLEQELSNTASQAIAAIKSGKPENLMPFFAAKGVYLGVDGPLVSLRSLHEQMSARTGVYCLLFDSLCLKKEVDESRKKAGASHSSEEILSFRDHILKSNLAPKSVLYADPSFCGGTTGDGSSLITLEWERQPEGWKIVAIPYL
jgi:hypothetical protein